MADFDAQVRGTQAQAQEAQAKIAELTSMKPTRMERKMTKLGIAAIALSILCLVASLGFGAPVWVNIVGVGSGHLGLVLLGRARKDGGT